MRPEQIGELRKLRNQIAHGLSNPTGLREQLLKLGVAVSDGDLPEFCRDLLGMFAGHEWRVQGPNVVLHAFACLLRGRSASIICDPWAGVGTTLTVVSGVVAGGKALAFTTNKAELEMGRRLTPDAQWSLGDPIELLRAVSGPVDVVVSVPPFGAKTDRSLSLPDRPGPVELSGDLGSHIVVAALSKLTLRGVGLFVVPASFFSAQRSTFTELGVLGMSVEAAFALPRGTFAPYTNISTYLIVATNSPSTGQMFVAELSGDTVTNEQIIANFLDRREGGALELGRLVNAASFRGLDVIRAEERSREAAVRYGAPARTLGELATAISLAKRDEPSFLEKTNAIYIPLIGSSDVVDSLQDLTLKPHNYAQVAIDPTFSHARFVAQFLNAEFGKEVRELAATGAVIPKLNLRTLRHIAVFVPDLQTQNVILETDARIAGARNILLGLQNEVSDLHRELWAASSSAATVCDRLTVLSDRLSGKVQQHAVAGLDQWFETLPFPLASVLRAWQATPSDDLKTRYEHLLHFFEGAAQFFGVIFLSAFSSNEAVFEAHRRTLKEALEKQRLSFDRATFGTWKVVLEYLGKQTRLLLAGDKDARMTCAELFADTSLGLAEALSRVELVGIISRANKMRNDWTGHGGVVSPEDARIRNEQLLGEVQKLREVLADAWAGTQLISALHSRLRRGVYENEVSILRGSNTEFLKESWSMSMCLDVEALYLCSKDSGRGLRLLPLIHVGPSPQSAKNACYFFSRLEREGARFVSYHYIDAPTRTDQFPETREAINFLTGSE